jgi:hypothetical protein
METYQTIEPETTVAEDEPVFRWRLEQLERAGYDECSALELASRSDVDLHRAVELCAGGCPSETAYRILA